jgi:hypothetical protein
MKAVLIVVLFIVAFINIEGCSNAKREYDSYITYENGLGGLAESFVRGAAGEARGDPSDPIQPMADREQQLADAKSKSFNWACGWTALAVIAAMSGKSKKYP